MKILVVTDRFPPWHAGGAARVAGALASEYARAGHEVVVVHGDPLPGPPHDGAIDGLRAHWVNAPVSARLRGWRSVRNGRALGQFARVVAAERPDVAHAHNLHETFSFAALEVLARARVPTVLTLHDCMSFHQGKLVEIAERADWETNDRALVVTGWDLLRRYRFRYAPGRRRRIRRIFERSSTWVVAVSGLLERALRANRVPCHDVIHNGIQLDEFASTPEAIERLRRRLGLVGRRVVATFGRLTGSKGQVQIRDAVEHVRRQHPDVVLLAVGSPTLDLSSGAAWLVGTEPLAGTELAAAYGLADVVVVPSVCLDVFPSVTLEAMAAGRPVVVSRFAGTRDIIEEGRTGFVVDALDVEQLAGRIGMLLEDAALAARVGAAGRDLVEGRFTIARCASDYLRVFERLADSSAAR